MTIAAPNAAIGYAPRAAWHRRLMAGRLGPVVVVCLAILAIWYVGAIVLNAPFAREKLERTGAPFTTAGLIAATLADERPIPPARRRRRIRSAWSARS